MTRYIVRRLLLAIPLLIGVSILGYSLMHLAPGGPLAVYTLNPTVTVQDIERIKVIYGLDQPVYVQYVKWAGGMLTGDWGNTFFGGRPVRDMVLERIPATFVLMGTAWALAVILGVGIGILGAVKRYSIFDYLATTGAMVAMSFPTFWFGLMAIYIFSERLRLLPAGGTGPIGVEATLGDRMVYLIMPACVLGLVMVAQWSRYSRNSLLDVINQDYVRTAHAKGLRGRVVLTRHAFRNALIPLVVLAGVQMPYLLSGALVTESIFSWPGMGRLFLDALTHRDYPVMMAVLMLTSFLVIIGNLIADVLVGLVDPRVSLQ